MIDILLTIVTFSLMLMLFKYFEKYNVNNLQAIIINYFVASSLSIFSIYHNGKEFKLMEIIQSDYIYPAISIGILFIITFNLLAFGTQKVGIATATVSNKMSMIIPVVLGIYLFEENFSFLNFIGLLTAIIAIYLTSTNKGKLNFNKKYLFIIILIFFGQGIADGILNWTQETILNQSNSLEFFTSIFFLAGFFGLLYFFYITTKDKIEIKSKNVFWGVMLGIPNFFTLYFFINALKSGVFESSQIFPIVNMGIIILSALAGLILFKEKISFMKCIGLALAIFAIALITY